MNVIIIELIVLTVAVGFVILEVVKSNKNMDKKEEQKDKESGMKNCMDVYPNHRI